MENIQAKTGKRPEEFWRLANNKGLVKDCKAVVKHAEMLNWLRTAVNLASAPGSQRCSSKNWHEGMGLQRWVQETRTIG
jgi:hypothetical protein